VDVKGDREMGAVDLLFIVAINSAKGPPEGARGKTLGEGGGNRVPDGDLGT